MRIMQLVSGTDLNGAIRHCYELSVQLALAGHQVLLAHKQGAWISKQPYPQGVELIATTLKRRPSEFQRLVSAARQRGVDILHSHLSSAHFFGVLMGRLYGFPCVATSHMTHFQPHWFWNNRVIAPTSATARYQRWINLVPAKRIDVIPYFLATKRFEPNRSRAEVRQELGVSDQRFVVNVIGRVCHRKAQHVMVQSIPQIVQAGIDLHVWFAGQIDHDYAGLINDEIDRLGVRERVTLLGVRSDTNDLIAASDCGCLSSTREVLPLAILETMGQGFPVVSTNVGGIVDGIRDGVDGFLVKPGRPDQIADRIIRLAKDETLRKQMGANAESRIRELFSPQVCLEKTVRCYEQACGTRTKARSAA